MKLGIQLDKVYGIEDKVHPGHRYLHGLKISNIP